MHDFHRLPIAKVKRETSEAISVSLHIPETLKAVFQFKPGQHLGVRALIEGEEQRRSYSICSGPGEANLRVAIKRIADGRFSHWANATLAPGGTLEAMPPAGRFVLPASTGEARHLLALAAGAGITPIIAMLKHAMANEPATSFTLIYGNRSPETILFREELEDLKDRHLGRFTLCNVLSRNDESSAPLLEGRITGAKVKALGSTLFKPDEIAHFYLCGPGSMIKETRNALFELGVARERVHHEFFAPGGGAYRRPPSPPVAAEPAAHHHRRHPGDRHPGRHPASVCGPAGRPRRRCGPRRRHPRSLFLQGRHVLHLPRQAGRGRGADDHQLLAGAVGAGARLYSYLPSGADIGAVGGRLRSDVSWLTVAQPAAIAASTSPRLSLPKKISSPT